MRFRDLMRNINRYEQKLENVLLYVDFLEHELPIILLKDGSLLDPVSAHRTRLRRAVGGTERAVQSLHPSCI